MSDILRVNFEPAQYVLFFGGLLVLGLLEAFLPFRNWKEQRFRRWPANFGLTLVNVAIISALPVSGLFVADWAATEEFGILAWSALPPAPGIAIGVLARSLVNYGVHFAMHKVPVLWCIHRVHHADIELDVSSAVRFHPLEAAVQVPVSVASIALLGIPPAAIIIYELLDAFMAVWTHANIRLPRPLDRVLSLLVVTPHMHRIHHSSQRQETDSNFGATFAIWDRFFGTFRQKDAEAHRAMELGLKECRDERSRSFFWLLKLPFIRVLAPQPGERQS